MQKKDVITMVSNYDKEDIISEIKDELIKDKSFDYSTISQLCSMAAWNNVVWTMLNEYMKYPDADSRAGVVSEIEDYLS